MNKTHPKKTKTKTYSFEKSLEMEFKGLDNTELLNRFIDRKKEYVKRIEESYKTKLFTVIKMLKRELIFRGLEVPEGIAA